MSPSAVPIPGKTGYGLMTLTLSPNPVPHEQAFETINTAIKDGSVFLNAGEFYGVPPDHIFDNLKLIQAYFKKYPENRSKVVVSVKGALTEKRIGDCSPKEIARSINNIASYFPGDWFDVFEPARLDPQVSIEDTIINIIPFVESGKIRGISLSEINDPDIIRRAAKIYPISFIELEYSLWSKAILSNGIMEACRELKIPIVAYSPLGRGYLTGKIKSVEDIPENDYRTNLDRFSSQEVLDHNSKLVELIESFAESKKATPAQIALSWIRKHNDFPEKYAHLIPIPSSSNPARNHENNTHIELTDEEFEHLNEEVSRIEIKGLRYNKMAHELWGINES